MTHVYSDPERVRAVADALSAISQDLDAEVNALSRQAKTLMGVDWTGDASSSHNALWDEWFQSAKAIVAALATDADLLRQATALYVSTDDATAADTVRTLSLGTI